MNKAILVGNLTRNPDVKTTQGGTAVTTFSIAINRKFKNQNGENEADFINIVTWRQLAEICGRYLHKGSKVSVCGRIQSSTYEDQNGNKRYKTEVVADEVNFLTPRGANDGQSAPPPNEAPSYSGGYNQDNQQNQGNSMQQSNPQSGQQNEQQSKGFNEFEMDDEELPF